MHTQYSVAPFVCPLDSRLLADIWTKPRSSAPPTFSSRRRTGTGAVRPLSETSSPNSATMPRCPSCNTAAAGCASADRSRGYDPEDCYLLAETGLAIMKSGGNRGQSVLGRLLSFDY